MSSPSQCLALTFLPCSISLKPSSLPPPNIKCRSSTRFNIRGSISNDAAEFNAAPTRITLPSAPDMAPWSPSYNDHNPSASSGSLATATAVVSPDTAKDSTTGGIGILNFLQEKTYLVTGATGLLAKAFVEKIVRVSPDTRKIFLLVKAKDEEEALYRVKAEIIECELFKRLEEMHGENYRDFMMSKLVPVVGNMGEPNLGISNTEIATRMAEEVDVIVNSAASTTFDERYDVALNLNTKGPLRLLDFAMKCKRLRLFLNVSTAYVNGERQGVVREKPFYKGQSIAEEMGITSGTQQPFPLPKLDVHSEIKLASQMAKSLPKDDVDHKMKELGTVRARMFGWQDTYVFTKAMGEMMISSYKGNIPVAIIRSSIIESTYREPFPGWIQGNRMVDPIILYYGKGMLPGCLADPSVRVDIILIGISRSGSGGHGREHNGVSHVKARDLTGFRAQRVPSLVVVINPVKGHQILEFALDHFVSYPLRDLDGEEIGIERMKFFSCLDEFSSYIQHELAERIVLSDHEAVSNPKRLRKLQVFCKRTVDSLIHMAKVYEPYNFYKGWFHNENTQKLMAEMSEDELKTFPLDMRSIDWKDYFVDIHIPGLIRHVLKGKR